MLQEFSLTILAMISGINYSTLLSQYNLDYNFDKTVLRSEGNGFDTLGGFLIRK